MAEHFPTVDQQASAATFDSTAPDPTRASTIELDLWDAPNVVTQPGGRVTTSVYDYAEIRPGLTVYATTTTDPRGRATTTWTDMRERVLRIDDEPAGEQPLTSSYELNSLGELLRFVDSAGEVTSHSYDQLGNRTATTTPDGGRVSFGYDAEGKLVSRVSPNLRQLGQQSTYSYALGKLVGIDHPGSTPDVSYTYGSPGAPGNGAGRVIRIEDGTRIVTMGYNPGGAMTSQLAEMKLHNWAPSRGHQFRWTTTWDYDGLGRVLGMTYPDGQRLSYDYDAGGLVRELTGEEDGYETIIIGYDSKGNAITEQRPRTWLYDYVLERTYDEFMARRATVYGNAVETEWSYQPTTRWLDRQQTISPQRNVGGNTAYQEIQDLRYGYDAVGNVLSYANELPAPRSDLYGGPTQISYELDAFDRLVGAHGEWQEAAKKLRIFDLSLEYDEHRNVVGKTQRDVIFNGKKDLVQKDTTYAWERTYSAAAPGRATASGKSSYHYDANGNHLGTKDAKGKWIRQLTWDATDRMTMVNDSSASTTFKYDDRVCCTNG